MDLEEARKKIQSLLAESRALFDAHSEAIVRAKELYEEAQSLAFKNGLVFAHHSRGYEALSYAMNHINTIGWDESSGDDGWQSSSVDC